MTKKTSFKNALEKFKGDLTYSQLADKTGISCAALKAYTYKTTKPSKATLKKLVACGFDAEPFLNPKVEPVKVKVPNYTSRPFTDSTAFLVNKWHEEGMSREALSNLLVRPIEDIDKALKIEGIDKALKIIKKRFKGAKQ